MANPPGVPKTLPKTVPGAPYDSNGKGTQWVQIGGRKYYVWGTNGYSDFDLKNGDGKGHPWPTAAITKMAVWGWEAKNLDNDKFNSISLTACEDWLKGKHDNGTAAGVVEGYVQVTHPPPSVGVLPGEGTVTNIVKDPLELLGTLIDALLDPNFWLRVLEVGIGAVLVGVGLAHISDSAGATLRKVPVYGKVMPK